MGRGGGDAVLEIGPATHPCGSAPTHWLVTAAGSFHMQRPEQRQRDGVEVFSHHGVRLPVGDGGHRLDGGAFPQQVAAQELHSWSHGQQHGNHIPLNPGACWVTGGGSPLWWSGNLRSSTWEVFADDLRRLGGPGHAGVDQNVVLEAQRRQPLTRQLGLLAT